MEFFEKAAAVKLHSHLNKYLVADDDQETVRQSRDGSSRKARWLVERVEGNPHVIRLKSCHGRYLTASNTPFLLGMTGNKVVQGIPEAEGTKDLSIEWQPMRDGFQVKIKAFGGTYLRANGGTPPWRNSITHDNPHTGSTHNWILWDVTAVEIPENEQLNDYLSMLSSFSSVSDELTSLDLGSPVSLRSFTSPKSFSSPKFSFKKKPSRLTAAAPPETAMDQFRNAKSVRLRSNHDKYLYAEDDEESVSQDRNASSKNARWAVEFLDNAHNIIRLKSCHNKYLTASNQPFLLGATGRKVLQTIPIRLDSSIEWEPIKEGGQVKLRTRYGHFLRGNGGLPPWRNSVTHDIPQRTLTQGSILWDVDIVEISVRSPTPQPPPRLAVHSDSFPSSESSSPYSRQESIDSVASSPPKRGDDGRTIYYTVADESGVVDDDADALPITFKGNGVDELTRKLEEETGLKDIIVCTRSPLNGELCPLRLRLPPNNVTMNVVVVHSPSKGSDL